MMKKPKKLRDATFFGVGSCPKVVIFGFELNVYIVRLWNNNKAFINQLNGTFFTGLLY